MSFISFFLFISVAYSQYCPTTYSQYCPTTNNQSKCQTIKCFIYYHFINYNSQSNTSAKTIYKSQLTSHFLPLISCKKKTKNNNNNTISQSQIHNTNIISMLCWVLKFKEKNYLKGQIGILGWRLEAAAVRDSWVDQAARGAKGDGNDMGLWRLRLGGVMVACGDVVRG